MLTHAYLLSAAKKRYYVPRLLHVAAAAGLILTLQACGSGGSDPVANTNSENSANNNSSGPRTGSLTDGNSDNKAPEPRDEQLVFQGERLANLSADSGEQLNFVILIPEGAENLVIETSKGVGELSLVLSYSQSGGGSAIQCLSNSEGVSQICQLTEPFEGEYQITLLAESDFAGVELAVDYDENDALGNPTPNRSPAPSPLPSTAASPSPAPSPSPTPSPGSDSASNKDNCQITETEQQLLDAHNRARADDRQCGGQFFPAAGALRWNCSLNKAAYLHSQDMANNDYFDHISLSGESPASRAQKQGYHYSYIGENIAAGQRSIERAMAGWLDSPGHCANIMNANYTELGASVFESSSSEYGIYWTAVFGRPRS
ncbi:CAP domain-containing protein [Agaribacterium haliotis]|uniref:CAP domain-containing protein n=1 Tax=Agaribacterium haliotis TaxID=2013869 RepID=UPI000BB5877A|nr:CAP domain-containing protein [Agaribacterium haliotis]